MSQPKRPLLLSGMQLAAIAVLTIVILLIVDFSRRTAAGYYVAQAEKKLKAQIEEELAMQKELKQRRDYVSSDAYVEKWAREEALMIRPGDQPMILITPQVPSKSPDPLPPVQPPAAATPVPNWYQWWKLFFDADPWARGAR